MSFDITYYSFNSVRADKGWAEKGSAKIEELKKWYPNFRDDNEDQVWEVKNQIKQLDLEFGGVRNLDFANAVITEDSKRLIYYIAALHEVYKLEQVEETVTKDNLITIFTNLNQEKVNASAQLLEGEGFEFEDAKTAIVSFLIEMKPLTKDLIDHVDSVVYVDYHGSVDGEPKEVEEMLIQRVESKFQAYSHLLQGI